MDNEDKTHKDRSVIILGGGGHLRPVICSLTLLGRQLEGYCSNDPEVGGAIMNIQRLGDDRVLLKYGPASVDLANGLGSTRSTERRASIFERFKDQGFLFADVVHPQAVISKWIKFGEGVQVMAGAVIQAEVVIGDNTLINTRASVDHNVIIGKHCHISPGVTICGNVEIADNCHVGCGATIVHGVKVGPNSCIGAGAVVLHNVKAGSTVVGVPARAL